MKESDAFDFLANLEFFGVKLGLSQTRMLFDEVGAPDKELRFIHIAGSNGKGSSGAMLECALRHAGFRTGFYSSPHLVDVCERWRVNGEVVASSVAARALEKVRNAALVMEKKGHKITYFEATTAVAALIFAEAKVDFVIWETGMGGRLDSTNIVTPEAALLTSISLEHQAYLGDTVEKIAMEKAGIIKENVPVFASGVIPANALAVIRERAEALHAPLTVSELPQDVSISFRDDRVYQTFFDGKVTLSLPGRFQRNNASLVLKVLEYLSVKHSFDLALALKALEEAQWPGRFQIFPHENMLFDGAHNPECAGVLTEALQEVYKGEKFDFIYGSFSDKDYLQFLEQLVPLAGSFRFVPVESARQCVPPEELCEKLHSLAPEIPCKAMALEEALQKSSDRRKVLCGSLHLCGEALALRQKVLYRSSRF